MSQTSALKILSGWVAAASVQKFGGWQGAGPVWQASRPIAFSIDPQSGNKMKRVFHAPCFMLASDIAPTSDMMRTLVLAT